MNLLIFQVINDFLRSRFPSFIKNYIENDIFGLNKGSRINEQFSFNLFDSSVFQLKRTKIARVNRFI